MRKVKDLLRLSRGALEMFEATQRQLLDRLRKEPRLVERVAVLRSIRGVGEVTALTWALEICDPQRFRSIADAVSYCGLTSALDCSADKQYRRPISKQRNGHLQTVLIEAAKLSPQYLPDRQLLHSGRNSGASRGPVGKGDKQRPPWLLAPESRPLKALNQDAVTDQDRALHGGRRITYA